MKAIRTVRKGSLLVNVRYAWFGLLFILSTRYKNINFHFLFPTLTLNVTFMYQSNHVGGQDKS